MSLCKLTILPDNKVIQVPKGSVLLKALTDAGIKIDSSCGGQGICGRCRVIAEGHYNPETTPYLTDQEISQGYCLACTTLVEGDLTVTIPASVQLGKEKILAGTRQEREEFDQKLAIGHWQIDPRTRKIHLKLPPPNLNDNLSDLERIRREFRNRGINREIRCGLTVLRRLGSALRQGNWEVTLTLVQADDCPVQIIDVEPGNATHRHLGLAVDIGTTTVVIHLVDLLSGQIVDTASAVNAQRQAGDDVISRIIFAQHGGLAELNRLILDTVNLLIDELCRKADIQPEQIEEAVAAGNTTMTHLLLGIDPASIRREPYIPAATLFPVIPAVQAGFKVNPQAQLYCMPCVSSYIGGDITAGVLRAEIHKNPGLTLFIDIGTNGEIVLGNQDWLVAASCSAGPAFEGGGVKCGMRAAAGAIEQIRIGAKGYEPEFIKVIGGGQPLGICGSGIIDALAGMLLAGIIDRQGKIRTEIKSPRIRRHNGIAEYVLVWASGSATGKDIVLTEIDIDNVMRAKGAIYAGFRILMREMGQDFSQLDSFLIAGGLGNYLNIESAVLIGLLPDIPYDKFKYLGNSSVMGAYLALLSNKLRLEAEDIAGKMTNFELSVSPGFMEEYLSALFLPHTDLNQFPSAAQLLEAKK